MSYSPTNWTDGQNKYSIKDQSDNVIHDNVKLVYTGSGGTPLSSTNFNNIENGIKNLSDEATRVEKVTNFVATTGSANAYVLTNTNAYTSYVSGMIINIKANFSNTGSATINVDSLGAKTLKKQTVDGKVALTANDIISGQAYILVYDGTDMLLINPSVKDYYAVASNTTLYSATTARSSNTGGVSGQYTLLKSFKVPFVGTYRVVFDTYQVAPTQADTDCIIKLNNSAVVNLQTTGSYVTYTNDITVTMAGSTIDIYVYYNTAASNTGYIRNAYIKATITEVTYGVITD